MPNEYLPTDERLRVFVLFSGGASSGIGLVEGDNHGKTYEVVGAATDEPEAEGINGLRNKGIPVIELGYGEFCSERGLTPGAKGANLRYHEEMMEAVSRHNFRPHAILLSGYMKLVTDEVLQEYPDISNVHPTPLHYLAPKPANGIMVEYTGLYNVGDLTQKKAKELKMCVEERENSYTPLNPITLKRAFTGHSGVFDLLAFGYLLGVREIRSTVHRAIKEADAGAIEVESAPIEIDGNRLERILKYRNWDAAMDYTRGLQARLKQEGDVPATRAAIELKAERRLVHLGDAVAIDGREMPYKGLQLE